MSRKELYENKLQMDYFSEDYIRFEEDFQKTIEACKKVGFDSAFTFKYSPRPKTVAATYPIIDDEIVQDRFQRLLDELYPMFNEKNAEYVGKTVEVLLESESKNNALSFPMIRSPHLYNFACLIPAFK